MSDIVKRLRKGCGCNFPETTCMAESECADAFEAANEITRLRNELHIAEVWSARIIAGTQQDVIEIARLRAENERLTLERDRQYDQNAEQITRIAALEAGNEKLKAALERIADTDPDSGTQWFHDIARAALEGT